MAIAEYGKAQVFPRNDHVDIHLREVTLLPESEDPRPYVDVREFIKNGQVYGNGIMIPVGLLPTLTAALDKFRPDADAERWAEARENSKQ